MELNLQLPGEKRYGSITTYISVTRGIIDAFIICYKTKSDRMVTERGVTFSKLKKVTDAAFCGSYNKNFVTLDSLVFGAPVYSTACTYARYVTAHGLFVILGTEIVLPVVLCIPISSA